MSVSPRNAYLGVDGGGSKTRAALIDSQGTILAAAEASGSNPHNTDYATSAANIDAAVRTAIEATSIASVRIVSGFLGIAGIRDLAEQQSLRKALEQYDWAMSSPLVIDHDLSIAYASVLADSPGIVLICGTGSAAFGKDPSGRTARASGRDLGADDPGSGYSIGKMALELGLARASDRSRDTVASLALKLIEMATNGDDQAIELLDRNAQSLVRIVANVQSKLALGSGFSIGLSGSLAVSKSYYHEMLREFLARRFPGAPIVLPQRDPVNAAAQLALRS